MGICGNIWSTNAFPGFIILPLMVRLSEESIKYRDIKGRGQLILWMKGIAFNGRMASQCRTFPSLLWIFSSVELRTIAAYGIRGIVLRWNEYQLFGRAAHMGLLRWECCSLKDLFCSSKISLMAELGSWFKDISMNSEEAHKRMTWLTIWDTCMPCDAILGVWASGRTCWLVTKTYTQNAIGQHMSRLNPRKMYVFRLNIQNGELLQWSTCKSYVLWCPKRVPIVTFT